MKSYAHRDIIPYSVERARVSAPGPGLHIQARRLCMRCAKEKPPAGGSAKSGLWLCAGCK